MNFLPFITVIDFLNSNSIFADEHSEKVHQRIKTPCTIPKLKSYTHLTMKHSRLFCELCFD